VITIKMMEMAYFHHASDDTVLEKEGRCNI